MPPRHAYWTILVDGQPTAFRAALQEDLSPTLNRLKEKHPTAEMKWFQNGKLWTSRLEAQDAMRERGERGRMGDTRQGGGFRDRKFSSKPQNPRTSAPRNEQRTDDGKLEWKPKGEFTPAPKREKREDRPEWKPKTFAAEGRESRRSARPAREGGREERSFNKPGGFKSSRPPSRFSDRKPARVRDEGKLEWKPKGEFTPAPKRSERPRSEWKPKKSFAAGGGEARRSAPRESGPAEKRKWIPKEEYKKSQGIEARRDKNWRPGGDHKDPRQKYKDAKKAKWSRFKQNIRSRWESKQGGTKPPKKRRDEE